MSASASFDAAVAVVVGSCGRTAAVGFGSCRRASFCDQAVNDDFKRPRAGKGAILKQGKVVLRREPATKQ